MNSKTAEKGRLGLDVGTSRIVAASRADGDYQFRSHLNAFVTMPLTQMAARTLAKEGVLHAVEGNEIIIYGNEAERFADLFHLETRRPMSGGIINPDEPQALALVRRLLEALGAGGGENSYRICYSVPAAPLGRDAVVTYHETALGDLLSDMGHQARPINEGLAVIYSELEDTNYTGIGISFGGGLCNVCLAYLSAPLFSFSVAKAGDFIDSSAAAVTNELATRVRIVKEKSFGFNGNLTDKVRQAIQIYYQDMIQEVIEELHKAFSDVRNVPKLGRAVPLVLSGGSALAGGFRERFEAELKKRPLPVPIAEVRLAADPLNATARGALVAALAEM